MGQGKAYLAIYFRSEMSGKQRRKGRMGRDDVLSWCIVLIGTAQTVP